MQEFVSVSKTCPSGQDIVICSSAWPLKHMAIARDGIVASKRTVTSNPAFMRLSLSTLVRVAYHEIPHRRFTKP